MSPTTITAMIAPMMAKIPPVGFPPNTLFMSILLFRGALAPIYTLTNYLALRPSNHGWVRVIAIGKLPVDGAAVAGLLP